jgi:hypothetical protein
MSGMTGCAFALVRGWTWLYTCHLPDTMRDARRLEIESDLWESQHDATSTPEVRVAAQVLLRLVLGIPDDLRWRFENGVMLDRLRGPAGTRAMIAATAGALVVAAVWATTFAHNAPAPPSPPDLRVFVVGSRHHPSPPPPPPPPPSRPGFAPVHP